MRVLGLIYMPNSRWFCAINATQVQVVFSATVDKTLAETVTNYSIKRAGASAVAMTTPTVGANDATAKLGADGKTVTITLLNPVTNAAWGSIVEGDVFQVIVKNVQDVTKVKTIADTTNNVTYTDKVAPTLVSATASAKTTTNQITLSFSEPVDRSVASVTINGVAASLSAGTLPTDVIVTSGSNLLPATTYNLSLLNFKDVAGNLITPNPVATTVTVVSDVVAPVVQSVLVVSDNVLEVTFDKSMNASTIANTSIKVLDLNLGTTGITEGTVTAKANTNNMTFLVPLTAVPFDANGVFTGLVSFTNAVKDASGNAIAPKTQNITITKDVAAPTLVSATYTNKTTYNTVTTANGAIILKFNEKVTASAAVGTYVIVDDQGATVTTPSARTINPNDATELVLALGANVGATIKSYNVVLPSDAVRDLSVSANQYVTTQKTVDVSAGIPVASDVTAPVVASDTETPATNATSGTSIAIAFTEAGSGLDVATVQNTSNYQLDGLALPSGSYVTIAGTTATLKIPAGTIAKDKAYALNVVGIKDKAGNVMTPYVGSVTLKDDIIPQMTSAALNTDGSVSIGFSEAVIPASGMEPGLQLVVNGSAAFQDTTNPAYVLTDGAGADAGKYVLKVKKSVQGQAATANSLTVNGATYTTVGATDVITFNFIDVDGSQTYNTGDILISFTNPGNTTGVPFAADGTYDLNNALSIKVTTTGTTVKDTSGLANVLKAAKAITVK